MDANSPYYRQHVRLFMAGDASSPTEPPGRGEEADELRERAASYRRLALRARTRNGSAALKTVADQFDDDARRIDPSNLKR